MTKTMEPFSDGRNISIAPHSMDGFNDELMTPIIDPLPFEKDNETACQWIDSSHTNLSTNVEQSFIVSYIDSPNSFLSTCYNSPPESVKSNISNEDTDCATNSFLNDDMIQSERSYNFVDALTEPLKNSQDLLYSGATSFHEEIEKISNEQICDISNPQMDLLKNESETISEDNMEPIWGTDLMLGQKTGYKFSQIIPKTEPINESVSEMIPSTDCNMNNIEMPRAQQKLLTKRKQTLPKLQLTVKVSPIESGIITNMDDKHPIINLTDVNTPQLYKDILDMENDFIDQKLDLVTYIDSDNEPTIINNNSQIDKMIEFNPKEEKNIEETVSIPLIEQILPTPVASPCKIEIDDEIQPPSTVTPVKRTSKRRAATKIIDFCDEIAPKRPRGRPPKSGPTQPSPSELKRLNPTDQKYLLMRVKNNEASRRSRLHRKDREGDLFKKLEDLERRNVELHAIDAKLDIDLEKWKKKFIKLYAL